MQIVKITRVFCYNGMELPDPDPSLSPKQVADVYAGMFPELNVCSVSQGEMTGNTQKITFTKAAGSKSWTKTR